MKSFQERLFQDFDVRQELQKNGRVKKVYVYKGDYAVWDLDEDMLRRSRRLHLSGIFFICLLYIWGALQRIPVNSGKLVGCFTLISLVAMIVLVMGGAQFVRSRDRMYLRDCRIMRDEILWSSVIYCILQAANTIAGIVYCAGNGGNLRSGLVLTAYGISALLSLIVFLAQNKMKYKILEK